MHASPCARAQRDAAQCSPRRLCRLQRSTPLCCSFCRCLSLCVQACHCRWRVLPCQQCSSALLQRGKRGRPRRHGSVSHPVQRRLHSGGGKEGKGVNGPVHRRAVQVLQQLHLRRAARCAAVAVQRAHPRTSCTEVREAAAKCSLDRRTRRLVALTNVPTCAGQRGALRCDARNLNPPAPANEPTARHPETAYDTDQSLRCCTTLLG